VRVAAALLLSRRVEEIRRKGFARRGSHCIGFRGRIVGGGIVGECIKIWQQEMNRPLMSAQRDETPTV
jgi:hypothetical protein